MYTSTLRKETFLVIVQKQQQYVTKSKQHQLLKQRHIDANHTQASTSLLAATFQVNLGCTLIFSPSVPNLRNLLGQAKAFHILLDTILVCLPLSSSTDHQCHTILDSSLRYVQTVSIYRSSLPS